jgi:hypothetical protein
MEYERLRQFNGDYATKEALIAFVHEFINEVALKRMYAKEDVSHIGDAAVLIDGAFEKLETLYGIQDKQKQITNEAK